MADDELDRERTMRLQGAQDSQLYAERIARALGIIERRYGNHWERAALTLIATALLGSKEYAEWLKKMAPTLDDKKVTGKNLLSRKVADP